MNGTSLRALKSMEYFRNGYTCSQSVACAFADLVDLDLDMLLRIASAFSGGVGRMREICGAVSGMGIILGCLRGCGVETDAEKKKTFCAELASLCREFRTENGALRCEELLAGAPHPDSSRPGGCSSEPRPCSELVGSAAAILERHLRELGMPGV